MAGRWPVSRVQLFLQHLLQPAAQPPSRLHHSGPGGVDLHLSISRHSRLCRRQHRCFIWTNSLVFVAAIKPAERVCWLKPNVFLTCKWLQIRASAKSTNNNVNVVKKTNKLRQDLRFSVPVSSNCNCRIGLTGPERHCSRGKASSAHVPDYVGNILVLKQIPWMLLI